MKKLSKILPALLLPAVMLPATLISGSLILSTSAFANWQPVCTGGATLRKAQGDRFRCVTSTRPVCADGRAPRTNHTGRDTCNGPATYSQPNGCKLGAGRSQSNWQISRDRQGTRDMCTHRTRNVPDKQIRCRSGFNQEVRNGADRCVKTSGNRVPASCPSGTTVGELAGQDQCLRERAPGWRNVQ